MNAAFYSIIENICEKDLRYKEEAYQFVMEALTYSQKKFKSPKHVPGESLLEGMKELILQRYGPLAMTVLQHWGVKSTEDFGHIVYNLVENQLMGKSVEDTFDSFRDAYNFDEVFRHGYRKQLNQKVSRMRSI